jgi:hypothetical protein
MVKFGFIVFSEGWRAQFVPIRPKWSLEKPFREALRPVFAAHGVAEK